MLKRLLVLGLAGIMLTACTQEDDKPIHIADEKEEEIVIDTGWVEEEEEEEKEGIDYSKDIDNKLAFDKDIQVVYVEEINNNALEARPLGGIAAQESTYYSDDELLYLFYDAELPTEETELIVVNGQFDKEYLLNHDTLLSDEEDFELTFIPLENELINNDNRLFVNDKLQISRADNQAITVSLNETTHVVEKGKELEVVLEEGDNLSTLAIKNYGLLNSVNNITYQEIAGMQRLGFEESEAGEEENEDN